MVLYSGGLKVENGVGESWKTISVIGQSQIMSVRLDITKASFIIIKVCVYAPTLLCPVSTEKHKNMIEKGER